MQGPGERHSDGVVLVPRSLESSHRRHKGAGEFRQCGDGSIKTGPRGGTQRSGFSDVT